MPRSTEILLVVATLLILGADVAIFVAPTIGVYAFIAAAPLNERCKKRVRSPLVFA